MDWKPEPQSLLRVRATDSFGIPTRKPTFLAKYAASEELWNRRKRKRISSINTERTKYMEVLATYQQLYGSKVGHDAHRYSDFT